MVLSMFEEGYIAGWRSVKNSSPMIVPPSPMLVGSDAYLVGFSRGIRDADATDEREVEAPAGALEPHPSTPRN
jgi:hypothetical protein